MIHIFNITTEKTHSSVCFDQNILNDTTMTFSLKVVNAHAMPFHPAAKFHKFPPATPGVPSNRKRRGAIKILHYLHRHAELASGHMTDKMEGHTAAAAVSAILLFSFLISTVLFPSGYWCWQIMVLNICT